MKIIRCELLRLLDHPLLLLLRQKAPLSLSPFLDTLRFSPLLRKTAENFDIDLVRFRDRSRPENRARALRDLGSRFRAENLRNERSQMDASNFPRQARAL